MSLYWDEVYFFGMKNLQLPKAKQLVGDAENSIGLTEWVVMAKFENIAHHNRFTFTLIFVIYSSFFFAAIECSKYSS